MYYNMIKSEREVYIMSWGDYMIRTGLKFVWGQEFRFVMETHTFLSIVQNMNDHLFATELVSSLESGKCGTCVVFLIQSGMK